MRLSTSCSRGGPPPTCASCSWPAVCCRLSTGTCCCSLWAWLRPNQRRVRRRATGSTTARGQVAVRHERRTCPPPAGHHDPPARVRGGQRLLGDTFVALGCTAVLPDSVFGTAGRDPLSGGKLAGLLYEVRSITQVCISREFLVFAAGRTSPVVAWLMERPRRSISVVVARVSASSACASAAASRWRWRSTRGAGPRDGAAEVAVPVTRSRRHAPRLLAGGPRRRGPAVRPRRTARAGPAVRR